MRRELLKSAEGHTQEPRLAGFAGRGCCMSGCKAAGGGQALNAEPGLPAAAWHDKKHLVAK
jgi:hypothetical protein